MARFVLKSFLMLGLAAFLIAGAGWAFLAMPALGQLNPEEERSRFLAFVEDQLSAPGRQIRIFGIDGALSSDASIARITISDEDGVWFEIENAAIVWTRTALFRGRLDVESLSADSISWPRMPNPPDEAPNPEARSFSLPDLPVSVDIESIEVGRLVLGEPLFGLAAELQTNGSFALGDEVFSSTLSMTRLDGPGGELGIDIGFEAQSSQLSIDATLAEPADGVVANLLNVHDRPALSLSLQGGGPLDALQIDLELDKDQQEVLGGSLSVDQSADGHRFRADLAGPIAELMAPVYRVFFGDESALTFAGRTLADGGLDLNELQLESGALRVSAAARTSSDGFLSGLSVDADLTPQSGSTVLLPVPGAETRLGSGSLSIQFGDLGERVDATQSWQAEASFERFRGSALSTEILSVRLEGESDGLGNANQRSVSFVGEARSDGLTSPNQALNQALGGSITAAFDGAWRSGEPLMLSAFTLDANTLSANAAGRLSELTFDGALKVESTDLSMFSALAGRALGGQAVFLANGAVNPVSGAFDLVLDGSAENLVLDNQSLDSLFRSRTDLSGRVARSEDGLILEGVSLLNEDLRAFVDGALSSERARIDLEAALRDIGLVANGAAGAANLVATVRQDGDEPRSIAANVTIPQGQLADRALSQAGLRLVATQADTTLDGSAELTGLLGGERIEGGTKIAFTEAERALSEIDIRAGTASISGEIVQSLSSGLFDGNLTIEAPNISALAALAAVRAQGSLNANVALIDDGGSQSIRAIGTADSIRAEAIRLGQARFDLTVLDALDALEVQGSVEASAIAAAGAQISRMNLQSSQGGNFSLSASGISQPQLSSAGVSSADLTANGQFRNGTIALQSASLNAGAGIDLSAQGTIPLQGQGLNVRVAGGAPLSIVRRFVSRPGLQLSGTIALDAQVSGSLSDPLVSGSISSTGSAIADSQTGIRLNSVGFNAQISPSTIAIQNATARVGGGGSVSVAGQIGLGGGLPADISASLRDVRYADGNLVVATADGDLTLTGALLSGPTLGGTITVQRADIQVPSSFGSAAGFLDVDHVEPSDRVRATFSRAQTDSQRSSRSGPSTDLRLNVRVDAPNQIYVRGRGVDAELGGSVSLGGTVRAIQPVGAFNLLRGRIDILGERIELDEGSITLIGDLDPFIDVLARTEGDDIDILIRVSGRVSEPEITLSSQPELPQDEILARLVFDRGLDELSPIQLGQLALAAAQLAGQSSGSALGSFRDSVGLSDLDIVTDDEGNAGVQATQYIQDNIYVGVEATTAGNATTTINLDITESVTVRGAVDTEGASSVGIFLERDY